MSTLRLVPVATTIRNASRGFQKPAHPLLKTKRQHRHGLHRSRAAPRAVEGSDGAVVSQRRLRDAELCCELDWHCINTRVDQQENGSQGEIKSVRRPVLTTTKRDES